MPRTHSAHNQRRRQISRQHHMQQTVGERRVEDDLPPIQRNELPHIVKAIARRGLHPAVHRQDPSGRKQRAKGNHRRCEHMQPRPDPFQTKQHDAQKAGLKEEGRQHLIGHQRPDHRPRLVREDRPVGAELIGHHNARHDAHAKGHGKDLFPVVEKHPIGFVLGPKPKRIHHRQKAGQPDRERRKDNVKRNGKGELDPCQNLGGKPIKHVVPRSEWPKTTGFGPYTLDSAAPLISHMLKSPQKTGVL